MVKITRKDYAIPGIDGTDGYLFAVQVRLAEVDRWKVGFTDSEGTHMPALEDQHKAWIASNAFKAAGPKVKRFAKQSFRWEQKKIENWMWWLLVFAQSAECPLETAKEILSRLALYGFGGLSSEKVLNEALERLNPGAK